MKQRDHIHSYLKFALIFSTLISFSSSCKKDHSILGANVQDQQDVLNAKYSDTATIYAHTIKVDTISSYNDAIKFLGSNQDPVFGRTDVSLYTKFSLPNNIVNASFGDNANLISSEVILAVRSLDFVGDYTTPLTYQVFEMTENITNDTLRRSPSRILYNHNLLGTFTGTMDVINGTLVVRIPINPVYAAAILNNPQYLTDVNTFQNTYKGFYITTKSSNLNPSSAQGAITRIDLENSLSGFYIRYQNGTVSESKVTQSFTMPFSGTNVVRFNQFQYNYLNGSNNLLSKQLLGDTSAGSQGLFLKGIGSTKIKLEMPYLSNYVSKHKIAVNQALVIFNVDPTLTGSDVKYIPPPELAILAMDSLSREIYTYDQLNSVDFLRYGGVYDNVNNQYVFNISRDIQAIMNGTRRNWGYYLVVANGNRNYTVRRDDHAERVVLGGTKSLFKPMLKLTFTPFVND